jgi:class 3 adenylate cyclase
MKKVIQYFIPDTIPLDAESQRKARLTVSVLLIIIYFNVNYCILSYFIEYHGGIISQLPLMIVGIISLMLYRYKASPSLLYPIYFFSCSVSIAVTVYYTGGFTSVLFPWLASTPIVAVLVWGRNGGRFSSLIVVLIELWFFYLYQSNYTFPNQIKPEYQKYFYLACNLGLPLILFFVALVFENARQAALDSLQITMNALNEEKEKNEKLLHNILPEEIAIELKDRGSVQAKLFDSVTVLFTDFKDFTRITEQLSPVELVKEIHDCFTAFDAIIDKYGLEKIKTIGDCYMAASGMPTLNTLHANTAAMAALEMRDSMLAYQEKRVAQSLPYFEARIGLHSGAVVAGIVGTKKFQYDIWGDTVNTASRMESAGEPGRINISGSTFQLIQHEFQCIYRGKVAAKGKGEIDMYFVE